jgi:hypothetical protein
MPEENCAIFRAGCDVAVRRDVALRSSKASHDAVVTKNDLKNNILGSFSFLTKNIYNKSDTNEASP